MWVGVSGRSRGSAADHAGVVIDLDVMGLGRQAEKRLDFIVGGRRREDRDTVAGLESKVSPGDHESIVALDRYQDCVTRPWHLSDQPSSQVRILRNLSLDDDAPGSQPAHLADVASERYPIGCHDITYRQHAHESSA